MPRVALIGGVVVASMIMVFELVWMSEFHRIAALWQVNPGLLFLLAEAFPVLAAVCGTVTMD